VQDPAEDRLERGERILGLRKRVARGGHARLDSTRLALALEVAVAAANGWGLGLHMRIAKFGSVVTDQVARGNAVIAGRVYRARIGAHGVWGNAASIVSLSQT
jgi:hypothetical protein